MKRLMTRNRTMITLTVLSAFSAQSVKPAHAASPVVLRKCAGAIDLSTARPSPFVLEGATAGLGKFTAYGEVQFAAGARRGSLVGRGVVAFKTGRGNMVVGDVSWDVAPGGDLRTSEMRVSWRDSIELSDGTVVVNTGDIDEQPQQLVVIAIIAILIGMLLPAVQ
jgi:hypothetical protein